LLRPLSAKAPQHIGSYFGVAAWDKSSGGIDPLLISQGGRDWDHSPGGRAFDALACGGGDGGGDGGDGGGGEASGLGHSACDVPWECLGVKRCDQETIWLGSASLLAARAHTKGGRLRVLDAAAPLFKRITTIRHGARTEPCRGDPQRGSCRGDPHTLSIAERAAILTPFDARDTAAIARWGVGCPSRPTHEAAPLLASIATRRLLRCDAPTFRRLLLASGMRIDQRELTAMNGDAPVFHGLQTCRQPGSTLQEPGSVIVSLIAADPSDPLLDHNTVALVGALDTDGGLALFAPSRDVIVRMVWLLDGVIRRSVPRDP